MSADADGARREALQAAKALAGDYDLVAQQIIATAEISVLRTLLAKTLPGGLAEYWQIVEQEIRQ